jgi:hypothetical protein
VTPASGESQEARSELSGGVNSPKRAPRWSAERRAAPLGRCRTRFGAANGRCAYRRSASLFSWRMISLFSESCGEKSEAFGRAFLRVAFA